MKIAHLLGTHVLPQNPSTAPVGGAVIAALRLAAAQVRHGHDVYVLTTGKTHWQTRWEGVHLVSLRYRGWAQLGRLDMRIHLPYLLWTQRQRPDIVHGHGYFYLRFLAAKRRIVHFHSDPLPNREATANLALTAADFAAIERFSDTQIAVSHYVAKRLCDGLGEQRDVQVIPLGVDHGRFRPNHPTTLRQQHDIPANATLFLYAGAIIPRKGVLHLVNAFCQMAREHPNAHLVLAGSSSLWNHTTYTQSNAYEKRVYATSRPFSGQIHALGDVSIEQMPSVYAATDVVVVPSVLPESFCLVALEGMATGLPVIAFDVPSGIHDFLNAKNGIIVENENVAQLQAAMTALLQDASRRERLGQAGYATAQQFSWEQSAQRIEQIYRGQS